MQNWDFFGTKFGLWSHLGPSPKFGTSLEGLAHTFQALLNQQGCFQFSKCFIILTLISPSLTHLAKPKSAILMAPCSSIKRLAGFKSLEEKKNSMANLQAIQDINYTPVKSATLVAEE